MKVFLTGATGFVGRHVLAEIRAAGHDILASTLEKDKIKNSPRDIQWLYGDLGDLECLKPSIRSFNPEVVIHLAWQGIPDFSESVSRNNLNTSIELFDFIFEKTNCRKIIVSGSCFEYGKKIGKCNESDPVKIDSYFIWAKHSLHQYLELKCREVDVNLIWFRIFYVYGPGQRAGSLIPTLIKSLKEGIAPAINSPMNKNDFVYVGDIARAFTGALSQDLRSGIYNLGSGKSTSVYDVCKLVEQQLTGSETLSSKVLENGSQEQSVNFWANTEKTYNSFYWSGQTSLKTGIAYHIDSALSGGI